MNFDLEGGYHPLARPFGYTKHNFLIKILFVVSLSDLNLFLDFSKIFPPLKTQKTAEIFKTHNILSLIQVFTLIDIDFINGNK